MCTTATAALAVGQSKITFAAGQLTTGAIAAASSTGLTVTTSADLVSAGAAVPALRGTVQSPVFELAAADQKALQATTAVTNVTFTTQTAIASGGTITISLPSGYFSGGANPTGAFSVQPSSGTASLSGCALTAGTPLKIVCTTATAALAVGQSKITFAAGQLTTGPAVAASSNGLTVTTSEDTVSAGAAVPALNGTTTSTSPSVTAGPAATTKASASSVASSAALMVAAIFVALC